MFQLYLEMTQVCSKTIFQILRKYAGEIGEKTFGEKSSQYHSCHVFPFSSCMRENQGLKPQVKVAKQQQLLPTSSLFALQGLFFTLLANRIQSIVQVNAMRVVILYPVFIIII